MARSGEHFGRIAVLPGIQLIYGAQGMPACSTMMCVISLSMQMALLMWSQPTYGISLSSNSP